MIKNQELEEAYNNWFKWNIIIPFLSVIFLIVVVFAVLAGLMTSQINNIDFFFHENLHYAIMLFLFMIAIFIGSFFLLFKYFQSTWTLFNHMEILGFGPFFGKSLGFMTNFIIYVITSLFLFIFHVVYMIGIIVAVKKYHKS